MAIAQQRATNKRSENHQQTVPEENMSDVKTKRGRRQDRSKINVNEDYELSYWTKKFGVTRDELREAVKEVGPSAANVERKLKHAA
jgi:uncharacterized protein DUF3606